MIAIDGVEITQDMIKSVEESCTPELDVISEWDLSVAGMLNFQPGPFIVATITLKDGRVVTQSRDNPDYLWVAAK